MDTFQHSYYALNRRLLVLIGQWPDQNFTIRLSGMFVLAAMLLSFTVCQVSLLFSDACLGTLLEIMPQMCAVVAIAAKFLMLYIYRNNIKILLERIIDNWKMWKFKEQIDIMHEFGKEGKFLTLFYTIYIAMSTITFLLLPFLPRIMDYVVPLNESRLVMPLFRSEYFIDESEHFISIYLHMSIVIVISITVLVASDVLFLIFNSHICGVFEAVGFHLEHFLNNQTYSKRTCIESIIFAIKSHKRALEFAQLIESSYSIPLCVQVSVSLICMSVSLFQILITLEKPSDATRYILFAIAQVVHLFCICYSGQRMINYSTEIQFKAYSGLWYEAPIEVHRLILLIMRRSLGPCYLTAGKILVFSLESFSTIMQTSTSYFMVISGVQ